MLLGKIGCFHDTTENAIHTWEDEGTGKIWGEQKQKTAPRCPMSHPQPSGTAPSHCRSPASGMAPSPGGGPAHRAAVPFAWHLSFSSPAKSLFLSFQIQGLCFSPATTPRPVRLIWWEDWWMPWLNFDYVTSGLGEIRLSFKLTILIPNSSSVCAGLSTKPTPSLDHSGFPTLILSDPFSRFSQARLLPFMVAILAPTVDVSAKKFPLCCSYVLISLRGMDWLFPREIRKPVLSCLCRD